MQARNRIKERNNRVEGWQQETVGGVVEVAVTPLAGVTRRLVEGTSRGCSAMFSCLFTVIKLNSRCVSTCRNTNWKFRYW